MGRELVSHFRRKSVALSLDREEILFFRSSQWLRHLLLAIALLCGGFTTLAIASEPSQEASALSLDQTRKTIKVQGQVFDDQGLEVIGATVRAKNDPTKGTATNLDGAFTIEVPEGEILVISYIGYKTVEVAATPSLTIKLEPDTEVLEDVVVVGYMPRKVANTSASVVKISAEQISNKPVANPLDAISGKVAGLQVYSSSGEPSAQLSIALHGQGSLGAGTAPLFIMDGMPISSNTIRAMNPNDIESVQFLKDAAATSIYGARAANGVVYITTKRGKSDSKPTISVRGQYGVSSLANSDYFEQLMTADELMRYYIETGVYTEAEIDRLQETTFKGTDFKWYKYIYQNAPMYTADASISGGSGNTNYFISLGTLDQQGLRLGSGYKKVFGRVNLNTVLSDYIRMGLNTSVSYDDILTSPFGSNNASGGGLAAMNPPFISPYDPTTGEELNYIPILNLTTPKHTIESQPSGQNSFIFSANGNVTITPIRNLIFRSVLGVELAYGASMNRTKPSYRIAYGDGSSSRSYSGLLNFSTTNTLSYLMTIANDHHLTTLLGQEYITYRDDNFYASGTGIIDDRLLMLNNVTKDYIVGEGATDYSFLSFFSQVSYDYLERYFIDLVLRNDASSRFGKNKQNGLFWSVGLLWKAKKESFLRDYDWLNDLDIKASYGTQGNSAIPPYMTSSYAGKVGQKQGKIGIGLITYGNPDLSWEKQSKLTVGFKARLFNRLGLNLEYYLRRTTDMLFEVPISHSSGLPIGHLGFVTYLQNIGAYQNQGVDLRIDADLLRGKDYSLSGYFNFNYNRDKVLELFDGRDSWYEPGSQLGYIVGQPITFVVPIYKGVNTETGKPEWYQPGNDIGVPTRDDSRVVTEWDASLEQNTGVPVYTPMTGGWGLYASWKGFYLSADFFFAIDKHMLSLDKQRYENDYYVRDKNNNFNGSRNLFDYWKKPGDVTEFPSLDYLRDKEKIHQSHYLDTSLLEDATFMRMKNLTIGYQIPRETLEELGFLSSARIYFVGRNLLTFTKFRGIDPEVNNNVSFGANPNTKQLSVGVELTF